MSGLLNRQDELHDQIVACWGVSTLTQTTDFRTLRDFEEAQLFHARAVFL
jgi:hypothetical protein